MITYFIESTLVLGVAYLYYFLFLRNETCHSFKRYYLIGASLLAVMLPLIHLERVALPVSAIVVLNEVSIGEIEPENLGVSSWYYMLGLYLLISALLSLRLALRLLKVVAVIRHSPTRDYGRFKLVKATKQLSHSSFLNYIFWPSLEIKGEEHHQMVLEHEVAHVEGWHTLDLLFFELLKIGFWFNPVIYLVKQDAALNLEYLADTTSAPEDHVSYSAQLATDAVESFGFSLGNYFNKSFTIKRINMLNRKKEKTHKLKVYSVVPVVIALFFVVSCDTTIQDVNELKALNDEIFLVADVIPEPTIGWQGFWNHIASNLKYPQQAVRDGTEGKVHVQFVVTQEGKVDNVMVTKGIGNGCDQASVEVIESYQDWKPGLKDGQPVNIQMVLPITFKIDENTPKYN